MTPPVPKGPLRTVPAPLPLDRRTVREKIAAGRKFEPEVPDRDGARCVCGDGTSPRDRISGLCVSCWRHHRWSPIAEYELK